ncbi:hypothetical protein VT50_0205595 [Streptomyces antioxidans]|uniref:Uncharacterized protein n=1 Tax=Streptomyces antioxidans TaxID=1507734 RepID=A0A1V4DAR6_9ACTN|nr:hypothetical protein [Streptomyces antioxidans]OPF83183.1 hypothetical protein VT50_0205595 [Streptomyces antioxidans]
MGADGPVPRRQQPGAQVQLVAFGAGQLEGTTAAPTGSYVDRARVARSSEESYDPRRERELWDAVERFTVAPVA